jgi:pSer/pThr/pTyr-binding forkhead associated (FHA) protein
MRVTAIVLNLINSIPAQSWSFDPDKIVRVGRATDNNVILFSAVVSRHHVEVRPVSDGGGWEIVNLSSNGTYIDGEPIDRQAVTDGVIFRLATSGPKIQVNFKDNDPIEPSAHN